jgi:hypothetical protein
MNRKLGPLVPLLAVSAVSLAACGGSDDDSADSGQAMASTQKARPTVTVTSPGEGKTIGSAFTAEVDLKDFELDPEAVGMKPADGMGHLHFSLDGGKFDSAKYSGANGKLAEQLGTDGKYSPSVTEQVSYKNIPAGEHTLEVALANNDHSDTGQTAQVRFIVASKQAKAGPDGERVRVRMVDTTADGFTATVALKGIKLNAKAVGMKPMAGEGHLHFELDGGKFDRPKYSGANGELAVKLGTDGKYSPAVTPSITYANLPAGRHTLKVYVANNDHSENGAVATRTVAIG